MKQYFLSGLCLFLTTFSFAQTPAWDWATIPVAAGAGSNAALALATDAGGNVYSGGYFGSPTITLGSTTFTKNGSQNMFFAKWDPSGNVLWAASAPDSGFHNLFGIAVDGNGDVYVTGSFNTAMLTLSPAIVLTNQGLSDVFVAKYSSTGVPIWAASVSGTNLELNPAITTTPDGNVVVTASFNTPVLTIGGTQLTNAGGAPAYDMCMAKFNGATGAVLWAASAGGAGDDRVSSVAADDNGNVYLTGNFNSTGLSFGTSNLISQGGYDVFVAKFDASGISQWGVAAGGTGDEHSAAIVADASGNTFITGHFEPSSFYIGPSYLHNPTVNGNSISNDYFLAMYDASGTPVWGKSVGGGTMVRGSAVALDAAGNICVTGGFTAPSLNFHGVTLANPTSTSSTPRANLFVAKYTPGGSLLWVQSAGGSGNEHGMDIADDVNGNTLVCGFTESTSINFGAFSFTTSGYRQPFVARLAAPCAYAPAQPAALSGNTTVCSGSSQTYSVPLVNSAVSYMWTLPSGWVGSSTSNSITVTAGTTTGDISVAAVNACGTGMAQLLAVTTFAAPTPAITQSGLTLTTAAGQGSYQWYKNGVAIAGATGNSYMVTANAAYYVRVTNTNGCTGQSNTITISSIKGPKKKEMGMADGYSKELNIYPNPTSGNFTMELPFSEGTTSVAITDAAGKLIKSRQITEQDGAVISFDLTGKAAGLYFITADNAGWRYNSTLSIR
jgi:hypothetical protein